MLIYIISLGSKAMDKDISDIHAANKALNLYRASLDDVNGDSKIELIFFYHHRNLIFVMAIMTQL